MLVEGIEEISGFGDGFLFQYPFLLVPIWSIRFIHSLKRRLQVKNASLGKKLLSQTFAGWCQWCSGKAYKVMKIDPVHTDPTDAFFSRRFFGKCHGYLAKLQSQF